MVRFGAFAVAATLSLGALGSWYWPFGSDDEEVIPRVSELMEPASTNIDAATDFEYDGKFDEAIACYAAALRALDMIEAEYPDQMKKPELTTVKTKRAYVKTKIDTLKFLQVKENSKAVAVSDTTELEKKLAEEKAAAIYGPMFLFYSIYDACEDKSDALAQLDACLDRVFPAPKQEKRGSLS